MPELRGFFAGSPRYVRSQILHGGAFETSQAKSSCHESFIKSIQVLAGRKDNPFAVPKLKASVSMGAAGAFCYFFDFQAFFLSRLRRAVSKLFALLLRTLATESNLTLP